MQNVLRWMLAVAGAVGMMSGGDVLGQICFTRTNIPTAPTPLGPTAGDFFGSGRPDIAYCTYGSLYGDGLGAVHVLRNMGGGLFAPAATIARGRNPSEALFADLDGDGRPELVALNYPQGTIDLFRNVAGSPTFWQTLTLWPEMSGVAAADLDGDGRTDLAVGLVTRRQVAVLFNEGGGIFTSPRVFSVGDQAVTVRLGDVDADGRKDIVVGTSEPGGVNRTVLLRNIGTRRFGLQEIISPRGGKIDLGDMDNDGDPDLVVSSTYDPSGQDWVGVCFNDGAGQFTPPVEYPIALSPWSPRIADFNGDGLPDVLVDLYFDARFAVFINMGGGVLSPAYVLTQSPGGPDESTVADFDGDGRQDVCSVGGGFSPNVFIHFNATPVIAVTPPAISVRVGQAIHAAVVGGGAPQAQYRWTHNGAPFALAGPVLHIESASLADAGEYTVTVTTACGTLSPARVTVSVALCAADWNKDGLLSPQDIFDFINAWFGHDSRTDINGSGLSEQDIFDFLTIWLAGC